MKAKAKNVVSVMIPRPPAWISTRRIACPNGVNAVRVSTTVSPVTQEALAEVKRASTAVSPPA